MIVMKYRKLKKKVRDIIKKYPKRYSKYSKKDRIKLMEADLIIKESYKNTKNVINSLRTNPLAGLLFISVATNDDFLRDEMMKVVEAESPNFKDYLKQ